MNDAELVGGVLLSVVDPWQGAAALETFLLAQPPHAAAGRPGPGPH